MRATCLLIIMMVSLSVCCGCGRKVGGSSGGGEVVIYSSIDEPVLRPLMQRFEKETGITVRIVTDTEATKSAGLAERLLAEKDRPQADVFWGNEIFHTINLAEQGVFAPYRPTTAEDVPAKWRGANDLYTDVGLRARTIAVSTRPQFKELVAKIHSLGDLTDPALKGKIAISHPAFGTASGHVAALYLLLGEAKFTDFLTKLKANDIKLLGGNSAVADQVAAGTVAAGLADNDDVNNAKADGQMIDGVLPDQQTDGTGTLLVPGTVAMVKDCKNADNAKKLIDFICQASTEKELIKQRFVVYSTCTRCRQG